MSQPRLSVESWYSVFLRLRATPSNKTGDFANAAIICAMSDPYVLSALMLAGYEVLVSINNPIKNMEDEILQRHWRIIFGSLNQSQTGRNLLWSLSDDDNPFGKAFFHVTDNGVKTYEETLTAKLQKLIRV